MRNREQLQDYLGLISRHHGGLDQLVDKVRAASAAEAPGGGLESGGGARAKSTESIEKFAAGKDLSPQDLWGLEAIINEDLRPAFDIVDGKFVADHPLWTHLSSNDETRTRIERCLPSVGRVELPDHPTLPYGGTGFIVGKDLLFTNRHVAEIFASGLGTRDLAFKPERSAAIDFTREFGRPAGTVSRVRRVVMIHPYWDMAILEVPGISAGRDPLRLSVADARELASHAIFVVGYPAFDPRNPETVQNSLFGKRFGVKKLQPGELQGAVDAGSFGKLVHAAAHDCSTLGGNSGSAVIDLETGHVLGLHFGGRYHEMNYAVPAAALAADARVVDAGVLLAGDAPRTPITWADWWARADAAERASAGQPPTPPASAPPVTRTGAGAYPAGSGADMDVVFSAAGGRVELRVRGPLHISLEPRKGARGDEAVVEAAVDDTEGLREPWHDEDYSERSGYDPQFLGDEKEWAVGLPEPLDPKVLAPTLEGERILHYQNFSIAMHAERRLALFTASNISREENLRKPAANKKYSRKDLAGLGDTDQEKWFLDPRLDERYQLPDVFFTKDRQAFDKGHLVRREDVAWGATYDELRRANGDTYHVTNCSPQVADFNRSNLGSENWGDLENVVLASASTERLCVFAGPVLEGENQVFVGKGDGGKTIRARIPQSFWKVIVARGESGLQAFGFVLEQDLSKVEWEFVVPDEFVPTLRPLDHIGEIAGLKFDGRLLAADQYGSVTGFELVLGGVRVWTPPQ